MLQESSLYDNSDDDDSFTEELSPSDGYFNGRPQHPQDILVPDPSQDTTTADKEREAREEQEAGRASEASRERPQTQQATQPTVLPTTRRYGFSDGEDVSTEQTSLLPSAPPAYSAATADSPYRPSTSYTDGSRSIGYDTMGRPDLFLRNAEPQDLGGTPPSEHGIYHTETWRSRSRRYLGWVWGNIGKVLILLLAVALGVGFIVDAVMDIRGEERHKKAPKSDPIFTEPGPVPTIPDYDQSCPYGVHYSIGNYSFDDPTEFEFIQLEKDFQASKEKSYTRISTQGEIRVRPAPSHFTGKIQVDVEIHSSEASLLYGDAIQKGDTSLFIISPSRISSDEVGQNPCIFMVATIWVAPKVTIRDLGISTQDLSVKFYRDLSLFVDNSTVIGASRGSVHFPAASAIGPILQCPDIIVHLGSGSCSGAYPLYDNLELRTVSGSIDVEIEVPQVSNDHAYPANLHVLTTSGHMHLRTPSISTSPIHDVPTPNLPQIPTRDYRTRLQSASGAIDVNLIHGTSTTMESISGHITASLYPVGPVSSRTDIYSKTQSGKQYITVHPSLSHPYEPMRHLWSYFEQQSGGLLLHYPKLWEGMIKGQTISGSIVCDWDRLRIIRSTKEGNYVWKKVVAVRGYGEGIIQFQEVSGSVRLEGDFS